MGFSGDSANGEAYPFAVQLSGAVFLSSDRGIEFLDSAADDDAQPRLAICLPLALRSNKSSAPARYETMSAAQ